MTGIFINYRSDDDPFAAALIDQRLQIAFGEDQVFRDCRSLHTGTDFQPELWHRLAASTVLLVLIGARWLTLKDGSQTRLVDRQNDFVRREIAEAFQRGLLVVPVLLNDAPLPTAEDLPDEIRAITDRQYLRLRQRHSDQDLDHLVNELRRLVPTGQPQPLASKSFNATSTSGNAYVAETMTINPRGSET